MTSPALRRLRAAVNLQEGYIATTDEILDAIADLLERSDASRLEQMSASDAVVWHNYDGIDVPAIEAFALSSRLDAIVRDIRIVYRSRDLTGTGAVARFELHGTVRASGRQLVARHCVFVTVDGGKLTRLDEYLDPSFAEQLGS